MENSLTFLVVEDSPPTFLLLQRTFEKAGVRVLGASTVSEAVSLACAERPDLIVMDVWLADGSGLEAVQQLRRRAETSDIPIIAMSAMPPMELRRQALAAGCQDYLPKPFRIYDLAWRVHRGLSSRARSPGENRTAASA